MCVYYCIRPLPAMRKDWSIFSWIQSYSENIHVSKICTLLCIPARDSTCHVYEMYECICVHTVSNICSQYNSEPGACFSEPISKKALINKTKHRWNIQPCSSVKFAESVEASLSVSESIGSWLVHVMATFL